MGERGHVYIMHNCSFPQVKIGRTSRTVEERAKELSSTSVPRPFIPLFSVEVTDAAAVERRLHERFRDFRDNPNREFFYLRPPVAIKALLEETGLIASPTRPEIQKIDITDYIFDIFGPLLDRELHRVQLEYTKYQQTLVCHINTGDKIDVFLRDISSTLLANALDGPRITNPNSLANLLREDLYYLARTTPIFSPEGKQVIFDVYKIDQRSPDFFGASPDRVIETICKKLATTQRTIEQVRKDFHISRLTIDAVGLNELHTGHFVLTNRSNGWIWDIYIESIDRDDDIDPEGSRSYAIIKESYLDELAPLEAVIIGHRYSEHDSVSTGPEVSVSGRTNGGDQFLQTFRFPAGATSYSTMPDVFSDPFANSQQSVEIDPESDP